MTPGRDRSCAESSFRALCQEMQGSKTALSFDHVVCALREIQSLDCAE
jgi:hypothetical protein